RSVYHLLGGRRSNVMSALKAWRQEHCPPERETPPQPGSPPAIPRTPPVTPARVPAAEVLLPPASYARGPELAGGFCSEVPVQKDQKEKDGTPSLSYGGSRSFGAKNNDLL